MPVLEIEINGRTHQIACDDGQETHVRTLAGEIDEQVRDMAESMGGQVSDSTLLLLTAMMLGDEVNEMKALNHKLKLQAENQAQSFEQGKAQAIERRVAEILSEITEDVDGLTKSIEQSAA